MKTYCTLEKLEKTMYYYTEKTDFQKVQRQMENFTLKREYNNKVAALDDEIVKLNWLVENQYYTKDTMDDILASGNKQNDDKVKGLISDLNDYMKANFSITNERVQETEYQLKIHKSILI